MSLLQELIDSLRILPGVGPKSAQRMAFHLLERDRGGARRLSAALLEASEKIGHCQSCRTFTEFDLCEICQSERRKAELLCVVENPADVMVIEQSAAYQGYYFVLMGHLSPLDGIGPSDLGLDVLEQRLAKGEVKEIILATNPTVEGEVTAHFINDLAARFDIKTSRIAQGVPFGGELEYVDGQTLVHAFQGRTNY